MSHLGIWLEVKKKSNFDFSKTNKIVISVRRFENFKQNNAVAVTWVDFGESTGAVYCEKRTNNSEGYAKEFGVGQCNKISEKKCFLGLQLIVICPFPGGGFTNDTLEGGLMI